MRFRSFPALAVLPFLLFSGAALGFDLPETEAEKKALYRALEKNWAENPAWKNSGLNRYRDGKPSAYMTAEDAFPEQSNPLTDAEVAALPEAEFVPYEIFKRGIDGLRSIVATYPTLRVRKDTLTLVDFDRETENRRFLVLDLEGGRVLFQTWVHHGRNSEVDEDHVPDVFSNIDSSYMSSLGFYLTDRKTYRGAFGHSVRLHGIDGSDLNSLVHSRAIVMHPWKPFYATLLAARDPDQTSLGCLSLPYYESGKFLGMKDEPLAHLIVDELVGRSVIYVHSRVVDLSRKSLYLKTGGKVPAAEARKVLSRVAAEESREWAVDPMEAAELRLLEERASRRR